MNYYDRAGVVCKELRHLGLKLDLMEAGIKAALDSNLRKNFCQDYGCKQDLDPLTAKDILEYCLKEITK